MSTSVGCKLNSILKGEEVAKITVLLVVAVTVLGLPSLSFGEKRLEIGFEDEPFLTYNQGEKRELGFEYMKQAGATWLRINIYPDMRPVGGSDQAVLAAIKEARLQGFQVQLTLTGIKQSWIPKQFADFVRRSVWKYRDYVGRYVVYNEPNLSPWLNPLPGLSQAESYYRLWRVAAPIIRREDKGAEVLFGELAAGPHHPLAFLKRIICPPKWAKRRRHRCRHLRPDGVAFHLYPDRERRGDPQIVGFESLDKVYAFLKRQKKRGILRTPQGKVTPIYIPETGLFAERRLSIPYDVRLDAEKRRAASLYRMLKLACRAKGVKQVIFYRIFSGYRGGRENDFWDTAVAPYIGKPDKAFRSIVRFGQKHPQCLKK